MPCKTGTRQSLDESRRRYVEEKLERETGNAPYQLIAQHVRERSGLSDSEILKELANLAPLCDETDTVWETKDYWGKEVYRFLALAEIVGTRRLKDGVQLLLERACFGDPGESMRGLRHSCEAAFNPDWAALAYTCLPLATSTRPGTRLWAIHQLVVIDDPCAASVYQRALSDDVQSVREIAAVGLDRLKRKGKSG